MRIVLDHISKTYNRPVLKDLSYSFESGKIYVIKGVSGCGKSTLLNILGGVEKDFSGKLFYETPDETRSFPAAESYKTESASKNLFGTYIFQKSLLISNVSVYENLFLTAYDPERIYELSRTFGIETLLGKTPETLSGGERQRVSVVRALLQDSPLLLADEPTASLDSEKSARIAETLAALRSEERIILIVTHEDVFDEYADEVISLDYGEIGAVRKNPQPKRIEPGMTGKVPEVSKDIGENGTRDKSGKKSGKKIGKKSEPAPKKSSGKVRQAFSGLKEDLRFIRLRKPELFSIKRLFLMALLFFVILSASAAENSISEEMARYYRRSHPMDLISTYKWLVSKEHLSDYPSITWYEFYRFEEDGRNAYYLPEKPLSVFMVDDKIAYGHYPENPREILIGSAVARSLSEQKGKGGEPEEILLSEFVFRGETFRISGILSPADGTFRYDWYYRKADIDSDIFIPYETIKMMGEPQECDYINGYCPNLPDNRILMSRLSGANDYYREGDYLEYQADGYVRYALLVLAAVSFVSSLFLVSILKTELSFRKKEIGYLQIFGLSRKRVSAMLRREYLLKFTASAVLAIPMFLFAALLYFLFFGGIALPNLLHVLIAFLILFLLYGLTVRIGVASVTRKSIRELIS